MKFCVKCGNKLEDNDMFCPKCGHKSGVEKGQEDDVGNTQIFNTDLINKQNNDFQFKENLNKEDFNDDEEVDESIFYTFRRKLGLNKKVAVITAIGILCITILVSFLIGNAASKPSNVVSKFQKRLHPVTKDNWLIFFIAVIID
ncbi:zinc-ribbon domain-containing protein [Clostridium ljungdahlii]|uniref:zinc-ribbon domain-containing protein n=1 Tax=Clostridium ljungdahlii TaxID=1538 RepID=UPI00386979C2